jgi:cytochrome bd-type quinol oxidase subunit 2
LIPAWHSLSGGGLREYHAEGGARIKILQGQFLLLDSTRMASTSKARRNFMPWVALAFSILSLACNVALFVGTPQQAALPWLSIFFAVAALFFLIVGLTRAFDRQTIYRGKTLSIVVSVFVLIIVSFIGFLSIRTRELPSAASAPQVGQRVPDFTLTDTSGKPVSLGQLLEASPLIHAAPPKAVLLIFYRGYW